MGWITIIDEPTIKFFSISEELQIITNKLINFIYNVSPGVYLMIFVTFAVLLIASILHGLRLYMIKM